MIHYFIDPLWNQDAKENEDQFFQQEEIDLWLPPSFHPPRKQTIFRKAPILIGLFPSIFLRQSKFPNFNPL
jgi:hypothetical protein